ncbi:xanthine dehydrogenase subunit D [Gordonia jinhuaensis]|uniref:Carbon-monoxide dehydrogenase large subunit n=1 Tax=Gordonia jinhuaensis TaxID=1517702 RepID=A0A916TI46_9ACTN|nr:molybdopterin cofactor-binding domain-containing protein [Gordonia jinhuaensis]GGB46151.1 carbon-monoxide dehydrogenase large subunit [Gordonia jinhuaensis]
MTASTTSTTSTIAPGRLGDSPTRPDAGAKVDGSFVYSSDLRCDNMLVGATLRSPHPHARILAIDTTAASAMPGVHAVLTGADVTGLNKQGTERLDQPALATDVVRHVGEPIAVVAADDRETARRAVDLIEVDYEVLSPHLDAWASAFDPSLSPVNPGGAAHAAGNPNIVRHVPIRKGDIDAARARADVVVSRTYEVGIQDQAFLGPEAALAVPDDSGGVTLYVASQWIHRDSMQVARILGLPPEKVTVVLAGVGGAFGGREDLTVHAHSCLLALATSSPIRMEYDRVESFLGHPHRHPAQMRYEHGARADGTLEYVRAQVVLDGGPYASCSPEVTFNAAVFSTGPYAVPAVEIDAYSVYTNNPVNGAMRGFGAVQVAFAHESQMDSLARELGMSPLEIRRRNAFHEHSTMPTGQRVGPVAVQPILDELAALPEPPSSTEQEALPGGLLNTTTGEGVRRGIGYSVGFKNIAFGEGSDDEATASVELRCETDRLHAVIHTSACEIGQGLVSVMAQIVNEEIGIDSFDYAPVTTALPDAGSTSASRQTYMTGGAVQAASRQLADRIVKDAVAQGLTNAHRVRRGMVVDDADRPIAPITTVIGDTTLFETAEYHHIPTTPMEPGTGQGDVTVQFAFCGVRAVVDVDVELGVTKVVALDVIQDVGRALNPTSIEGQLQGGALQGLGLAVMEEIVVRDGAMLNGSFTDYLIPTTVDTPAISTTILELADPHSPYGVRGVGEPPTVATPAAVASAIRDATGLPITRIPVRPHDLTNAQTSQKESPE